MSAPVDKSLREKQLARGFKYPRSMPVRKGDRVLVVRGEGKSKSATKVAKVDRKARKIYVEGFTYFKSDGTELQRPIDPSNVVIINPDWSDIFRRKLLTRVNESVEWTDSVISDLEAAEDEHEEETVGPIVEETTEESTDEVEETTEESTDEVKESVEEKDADEDVNYDSMKVSDLKEVLKEKGLPVSGKKSELIDRLKGESK
jgi:large subunit ribosomal protein L24|tara:strand:- start:30 stop:638 length:609 start_codon:yes stop_codon:yes gene_type:complete